MPHQAELSGIKPTAPLLRSREQTLTTATYLENVREGSEAKAVNTILGLTEDYQERDRANYEVEHKPTRTIFDDGSQAIDGHTAIELTDPDRDDAPNLAEELQEDVLSGLQYNAGMWGDDTFFVQDKEHERCSNSR